MPPTAERTEPEALARRVLAGARQSGARRVLLLDVDGTLAPIAPTPEAAAVPGPTLEALSRLVGLGWTIALVSGRPLSQVLEMVPVSGVSAFGSHGLESSLGNAPSVPELDESVRQRLTELKHEAPQLAGGFAGVRVELKPLGIAFHDRALGPDDLGGWHERLTAWLAEQRLVGLEVLQGKRVVEIRVSGVDKGLAVRIICERKNLSEEDPSFVAIGDDVTDEDMFRAMRGRGLAVRVGEDRQQTAARWRLATTRSVGCFLAQLAEEDDSGSGGKGRR